MLKSALTEFITALDDLEGNLQFIRAAKHLRPRLGPMLKWNELRGDARQLAAKFMKQKEVDDTFLYRGMLVILSGALEQFVRRILRDAIVAINEATRHYDDLDEVIGRQNTLRTAQALQTIFEPLDHLTFDYELLCKNLGTCLRGSEGFALNADAFTIYVSSIAPAHLEDVLKRIGINLDWDSLGQNEGIQSLFNKTEARETSKSVQEYLLLFIRKRNKICHSGSGGIAVSDGDIEQLIKFFRVFSAALTRTVEEKIRKRIRGK
jgi:hypothetical protein